MNAWLDAQAEGIALMLWTFAYIVAASVAAAAIVAGIWARYRLNQLRRNFITRIDPRCERAGSVESFYRRLRARR